MTRGNDSVPGTYTVHDGVDEHIELRVGEAGGGQRSVELVADGGRGEEVLLADVFDARFYRQPEARSEFVSALVDHRWPERHTPSVRIFGDERRAHESRALEGVWSALKNADEREPPEIPQDIR